LYSSRPAVERGNQVGEVAASSHPRKMTFFAQIGIIKGPGSPPDQILES
jgi:hypothetical protein